MFSDENRIHSQNCFEIFNITYVFCVSNIKNQFQFKMVGK